MRLVVPAIALTNTHSLATQLRHNLGVIGGGVAVKQSSMQASEVAIECCCSVRQAGGAISVDGVQPGADSGDAVQLDVSHSVLKVSPSLPRPGLL